MSTNTSNAILIVILGVIAVVSIGYFIHSLNSYDPCAGSGFVGTMRTLKPCS